MAPSPVKSVIIFLGSSHIDPEGQRRLADALEATRPEIILLEVSRFSLIFRKTIGRLYHHIMERRAVEAGVDMSPELANALRYLEVPAEYHAAREYRLKTGSKIILVDVSRFSFRELIHAHEVITRQNIETLSIINADRFAQERAIARRIFVNGDDALAEMKVRAFGTTSGDDHDHRLAMREDILTARVISCMKKFRDRRIAYVGGWKHCIDDPKGRTLYSRIEEPKERRIVFLEG
ncbi:MAG TPA: hypothetical protein PKY31_09355 [Spirochaetota bacterium]|nr:hypothetical protein [Spirochaetota bacterium]